MVDHPVAATAEVTVEVTVVVELQAVVDVKFTFQMFVPFHRPLQVLCRAIMLT